MAEPTTLCPHCGGNIETELNCSICRVLFGLGKTFRSEDWSRRTPGPATKAMLKRAKAIIDPPMPLDVTEAYEADLAAFLAEWGEPATAPVPEQPTPSSPWKCAICDEPMRIGDDLQPHHIRSDLIYSHRPTLRDDDRKILADGLRLTD